MKKLLFPAIAIVVTLTIFSCGKTTTPVTENPAKETIDSKVVVDSAFILNNGDYEFGNQFYSSRNGMITKLGCKVASKGNFRVSLWDFITQNQIAATTINVTDTTVFIYNSISPITITANTRYVVSLNNGSLPYYIYFKTPNYIGPSIYPFTSGSITYIDFREIAAAAPTFPTTVGSQYIFGGVPDIQFE